MKQLIPLCLLGFFQVMSTTAEALEVFDMDAMRDPPHARNQSPPGLANGQRAQHRYPTKTDHHQCRRNMAGAGLPIACSYGGACESKSARFPPHRWKFHRGTWSAKQDPEGSISNCSRAGVGLVMTVVQEPGSYGEVELGGAAEARFAKSLNPRYKIQYWAWPATLMRAVTAAYAEAEHFGKGNIAVTGSSKNGALSLHGHHP